MTAYSEKLKNPRWQKKRLEILSRDDFACQICGNTESTLMVHHRVYLYQTEPWDYPDDLLVTLCQSCHEYEHENGPNAEECLTENLKMIGIFSSDFYKIAEGAKKLKIHYASEVTASFLGWIIGNEEKIDELWQEFWDDLHKQNQKKEESNGKTSI